MWRNRELFCNWDNFAFHSVLISILVKFKFKSLMRQNCFFNWCIIFLNYFIIFVFSFICLSTYCNVLICFSLNVLFSLSKLVFFSRGRAVHFYFILGFYSEGKTTSVSLKQQLPAWHLSHSSLSLSSSLSTHRHLARCWCFVKPGAAVRKDEPPGYWRQNHIEKKEKRERKNTDSSEGSFSMEDSGRRPQREDCSNSLCRCVC